MDLEDHSEAEENVAFRLAVVLALLGEANRKADLKIPLEKTKQLFVPHGVALAAALLVAAPIAEARVVASAPGPVVDLTVDGNAAYYRSWTANREVVRRVDLRTGRTKILYATPIERFHIAQLKARAGRVAIGIDSVLGREVEPGVQLRGDTRVLVLRPAGGVLGTVASGHFEPSGPERDCGNFVALRDIDPTGAVVTEEEAQPCSQPRGGSVTLWRHGASGPEVLLRREVEEPEALTGEHDPEMRLLGGRLLRWDESAATVLDLTSGQRREVRTTGPRSAVWHADLDSAGSLLLSEVSLTGRRSYRFSARVFPPDGGTQGHRLWGPSRTAADIRFCGDRLVAFRFGRRGRPRLSVRERWDRRPRVIRGPRRRLREPIDELACDARRHLTTIVERSVPYSDGIIPTRLRFDVVRLSPG